MFIALPFSDEGDSQSYLNDWIIGFFYHVDSCFRLVVQKGDKFKDERTGACSEKIGVYCKRVTNQVRFAKQSLPFFFLPSATKLRRLCFYTCLSFCSQGGVPGLVPPWDQVHPPEPGTPPGRYTTCPGTPPRIRYTLWDQVHPLGGIPPGPGTPPGQVQPPGRYTPLGPGTPAPLGPGTPPGPGTPNHGTRYPWAGTSPVTRYTPWDQVHPPGTRYTLQQTATVADGTHPTRMQSCFIWFDLFINFIFISREVAMLL